MDKLVINCTTGEASLVPLSPAELADAETRAAAHDAHQAARVAERTERAEARAVLADDAKPVKARLAAVARLLADAGPA